MRLILRYDVFMSENILQFLWLLKSGSHNNVMFENMLKEPFRCLFTVCWHLCFDVTNNQFWAITISTFKRDFPK